MNSVIDLEIGKPLSLMRIPSQFKIVFRLTYILYTFRSIKCILDMFSFFLDFVSIFKYLFFFFVAQKYTHICIHIYITPIKRMRMKQIKRCTYPVTTTKKSIMFHILRRYEPLCSKKPKANILRVASTQKIARKTSSVDS